ncbi:probable membrane-associated kinase regulator 2 isoform X2 [Quercus lobata]|uniref:probable membrane-associated kinase regulator 2 isoform X2 n=1 Tax=Quercus lobata TaxID=97700 RepID=UPI001244861C|nr:probable membrane-associated kinase regulator 2 isoform X2 [Quercus lobata]
MEAFSLLKYWRGSGGGVNVTGVGDSGVNTRTAGTTTIVTAVSQTDDENEDNDDDGPFFDLEFTVPDEEEEENQGKENENENENENESEVEVLEEDEDEEEDDEFDDGGGDEREFKFTLSSGSGSGSSNVDTADPNLSLSPSDDLFFKGRLVPIEPSSLVFNPSESEPNSKPQFPVKLLKSATKFRVFMLGLKKSKLPNPTSPKEDKKEPEQQQQQQQQKQKEEPKQSTKNKSFTVKFKVEEVPIMSLFTRDSSKSASVNKTQKQNTEELGSSSSSSTVSEEKKFSKEVMQKYLKKVKPLYVRVSRRYGEKLRFSGQLSLGGTAAGAKPILQKTVAPAAEKSQAAEPEGSESSANNNNNNVKAHQKLGNIPTGLRVVCKHLGKSRSASSAVAAAPIGTAAASKRRDDSLLQQQDGIQSAIMHCKRSFNASRVFFV